MAKKSGSVAASKKEVHKIKKAFTNPRSVKAQAATEVHLQSTEHLHYLSFYHTEPPLVIDEIELSKIKKIESELVARIAVTPELLLAIKKMLDESVKEVEE